MRAKHPDLLLQESMGVRPNVKHEDLPKTPELDSTEVQTFGSLEDDVTAGATKFDGEKPMMQLFPLPVAESISKVLTFGAQKYAAHGWKKLPDAVQRYQGALLRHLTALQSGEEFDSDSGLPHVYHIGCNITFLIHFYNEDPKKFLEEISV